MPIIDDTSITEILSSDDVVSEIANVPHDELQALIDLLNVHHDGNLVHSGDLTISGDLSVTGAITGDSGIIDSLTADDIYLPSIIKIQSLTSISANVTSEALNELTSGGETTLHSHGQSEVKAWIKFDGTGSSPSWIYDSYNISSVVDNGVGAYDVYWDIDFASVDYSMVGSGQRNVITTNPSNVGYGAVNSFKITNDTAIDQDPISIIAIGDQ